MPSLRRAIASSTRVIGSSSRRQCTDSSIALWAIVPRDRDFPLEGFGLLEDELALTPQHLTEGVFGDDIESPGFSPSQSRASAASVRGRPPRPVEVRVATRRRNGAAAPWAPSSANTSCCAGLSSCFASTPRASHTAVTAARRLGCRPQPEDCHTPLAEWRSVEATSLRFAAAARSLGQAARLRSLVVPGFRSPPGLEGVHRTLRFRRGVPTVAVQLKGRPWSAVVADMIEGVVAANGLAGAKADRARAALWLAVDDSGELSPVDDGVVETRRSA